MARRWSRRSATSPRWTTRPTASAATIRTAAAASVATSISQRHKAFAKLDTNGDGKLSFEGYWVKAITKFNGADANHDGVLTAKEFATTAIVHKPRTMPVCPPGVIAAAAAEGDVMN